MEIISKRHLYKFYISLILWNLFFLTIIGLLISIIIKENDTKITLISFFILAIFISINVGIIKNAPKIVLNKEGISFKNNFYKWSELLSAKLTGKGSMLFNSGECATLIFKDATKLEIYDDFYSNITEMKSFIEETVLKKEKTIQLRKKSIAIENEIFISYKGNPVFSFRGILMWGLILLVPLLVMWSNKTIKATLFFNPFSIFFFLILAKMMNYFEISENLFIVKNHYYFWKKNIFTIDEIREVVFEHNHKRSNSFRLILKDFSTKKYFAGSLTDNTWREMKNNLEQKNIVVRNELYSSLT